MDGHFSSSNGEKEDLVIVGVDQSNTRMEGEELDPSSTEKDEQDDLITSPQQSEHMKGKRRLDDDFSVDVWLGGPMLCPVEHRGDNWFDPIASVECPLMLEGRSNLDRNEGSDGGLNDTVANTPLLKRPRGRPKRVASSLPDTLSVPSTPLSCSLEASATWKTATMIGISANEECAIMEEIRRSKRVQIREANNRP
ncbi:unnamed protein product [Amaranthus hypochondriacus]